MKELKKILYAEDELDIQIIVEAVIQSTSNYEIKICNNGIEVLNNIDSFKPDLLLLDVMMPEMDGLKTFETLQKDPQTKDIPVIFMTAKAQVHEVQSLDQTGALGIITKPFDPMQLCSNIAEIWRKKFGE